MSLRMRHALKDIRDLPGHRIDASDKQVIQRMVDLAKEGLQEPAPVAGQAIAPGDEWEAIDTLMSDMHWLQHRLVKLRWKEGGRWMDANEHEELRQAVSDCSQRLYALLRLKEAP